MVASINPLGDATGSNTSTNPSRPFPFSKSNGFRLTGLFSSHNRNKKKTINTFCSISAKEKIKKGREGRTCSACWEENRRLPWWAWRGRGVSGRLGREWPCWFGKQGCSRVRDGANGCGMEKETYLDRDRVMSSKHFQSRRPRRTRRLQPQPTVH